MDKAKSTLEATADRTSSAAASAAQTIGEAATKATSTSSAPKPEDSRHQAETNPSGGPGQEPVAGVQGKGTKDDPFDKGNAGNA